MLLCNFMLQLRGHLILYGVRDVMGQDIIIECLRWQVLASCTYVLDMPTRSCASMSIPRFVHEPRCLAFPSFRSGESSLILNTINSKAPSPRPLFQ